MNAAPRVRATRAARFILGEKRALAQSFAKALSAVPGLRSVSGPSFARSNFRLNAVLLDDPADRDRTLKGLHEHGFRARAAWTLLNNKVPIYACAPAAGRSGAADIEGRLINLPSSAILGEAHE